MLSDSNFGGLSSLILDSNLLLLYLVGFVDPKLIGSYKRTSQFVPEDFELLKKFVERFRVVKTAAGILAETSNLGGAMKGDYLRGFRFAMRRFVEGAQESYQPAVEIVSHESFCGLGFTDTDILQLASRETLVLTDDFDLWGRLSAKGLHTINFTHLRQSHLLS